MGLAFHNHHDQYGFFPSGGWSVTSPPTYFGMSPVAGKVWVANGCFGVRFQTLLDTAELLRVTGLAAA